MIVTNKISFFATLVGSVPHLRRLTDELAALHHGLDAHVEVLVSGVVARDAAEGIHDQLLLNRQQLPSGGFHTTPHLKVTFQDHSGPTFVSGAMKPTPFLLTTTTMALGKLSSHVCCGGIDQSTAVKWGIVASPLPL